MCLLSLAAFCTVVLVGLARCDAEEPVAAARSAEWQALLGEDAKDQWRGYRKEGWPAGWKLADGVLYRDTGGDDLMTVEQFDDFELRLEWKISSKGNSGIMYRVSVGDKAPYLTGPEYQILDDSGHKDGQDNKTSSAALYGLYARQGGKLQPVGEWNKTRIVVKGNHVEHWLNSEKVVECEMNSSDWEQRVSHSKFAKWLKFGKNKIGHVVLQDHNDPVWYRNIQIRKIKK
ncbi:MAG: DUF1080 domain-containing protein [Pirellulales bacterium]|nr:DUF1080 domain-containing protein [Pirellulales bacterium]